MLEMSPRGVERLVFKVLAPLRSSFDDAQVTEILINGSSGVFLEKAGLLIEAPEVRFSQTQLNVVLQLLAQVEGRVLHEDQDFELDVALEGPPPLRVHANFGPTSFQGVSLSFRKLSKRAASLEMFPELTGDPAAYLFGALEERRNIVIAGGTGTGKTTLLNATARAIPANERIVVIEDTQEIGLPQPNVLSLVTRRPDKYGRGEVTIRELFRSALRMRPDRLIIGEVRGGEAFDLIQALGSGHSGSLTTVHAESPLLALSRIHGLALQSGVPVPPESLRRQISEVVSAVVQVSRTVRGARRVTRIEIVEPSDGTTWGLRPLFALRQSNEHVVSMRRLGEGESS
jgi:pilus assembly protein CpaF